MTGSLRGDHHFAKALLKAMTRKAMTRTDLARRLKVSRATVFGWLNGSEPSDSNFKKIVRVFPELANFGDS